MIDYNNSPVKSCIVGDNAELIREAAKLYLSPGQRVADVTYGQGVFWKQVDTTQYQFFPSDLKTGVDFTQLPYAHGSMDVVVFDPPYQPYTKSMQQGLSDRYGLNESKLWTLEDVVRLYQAGMEEAKRVLTPTGSLWVKCQDVTYNHRFCCTHITLINNAAALGFHLRDMFILCQTGGQLIKKGWKNQQHARKNHSYLLILQQGPYR